MKASGPRSLGGSWVPRVPLTLPRCPPGSSVATLEIDNRLCVRASPHCFPDTRSAADYLAALSALERLHVPYPIAAVRGEGPAGAGVVAPDLSWWP